MATVTEIRENYKLTLTNGLCGAEYRVERLPRKPGEYAKGFRLTGPDGQPVFAHELPSGLQECSCSAWAEGRECEHTQLLTAAGLFDEPIRPDDLYRDRFEDDLVEIDWESDAP
jgi:hypothetical protein